jgi:hypothetical protein
VWGDSTKFSLKIPDFNLFSFLPGNIHPQDRRH